MYKLDYTITTLSPIIITKNTGDPNMVATEEYISGSSLLGALAGLYIHKKGIKTDAHKDDVFFNWFLQGKIIFTNGYICDPDNNPCYPAPLSVQRIKHDTGCYDLLFKDFEDEDNSKQTAYIGGFVRIIGSGIMTSEVRRSLNFHHERDYKKGSVKEGVIFNYESIDAGQTYKGMLIAGEEADLWEFIDTFGSSFEMLIGRSKTAQYGNVKIQFDKSPPLLPAVQEYYEDEEISLTFLSPTIILNEFGFSAVDIDSLRKALGEVVEIQKAFIKADEYEGYNSQWRLKKPAETCLAAGSCLLLKVNAQALESLKQLQLRGIGERTDEGFGRVRLDMQGEEDLSILPTINQSIAMPTTTMPDSVKGICKALIKQHMLKNISIKAMNDAKGFCNNNPPTKSLVSRLEAMIQKDGKMELDNLRKTAKKKLEDCDNRGATLLSSLTRDKENLLNAVDLSRGISRGSFLSGIGYKLLEDKSFTEDRYRNYWLTFFAFMRKAIKAKKGGQG